MNKAFTLIELLVVVAIVLILTSTALAYYNNLAQDKQLSSEVQKMTDVIELAKKQASSGYIHAACDTGQLTGYQVALTAPTTYELQQCCGDETSCTPITVQEYAMQSSAVSIVSDTGTVLFKTLSTGADISNIGNPMKFKTSSSKCIDLTISAVGVIETSSAYTNGC